MLIDPRFRRHLHWAIALTLLVNAASLFTPIINEGDSVLYAALSQHIALTGNWTDLVLDQTDWLDKPHFPFWVTALFFKLGGVSTFNYILPGFLFHLLACYYTYRLARMLYGRDVALLALLVVVSVYHLMYTSSAIKAEAFLTGSITAACYYWLRFDAHAKAKYLLLAALFSGISVMTKGVFTLITIASGLACVWVLRGQWRNFWNPKWLLALAISLVCTAPEVVALYLQFDAHPDKVVFGSTGVSGIRFFLWDSQFGRFFNSGPIKNQEGTPLYFVHVFLWAFLPWVAAFVAAVVAGLRSFAGQSPTERSHFVFLCGSFFVTFVLFSATAFQLDYYTVILFPFAAILCARYLAQWLQQGEGAGFFVAQAGVTIAILALVLGLAAYVANPQLLGMLALLGAAVLVYALLQRQPLRRIVVLVYPVAAVNLLYLFLEAMTLSAYLRYSVPYNVDRLLADDRSTPIYVVGLDPTIAWEIGIYRSAPSVRLPDVERLPRQGAPYLLLLRESERAALPDNLGPANVVAQGDWVNHKTGILPRQLRLAKGEEPLERFTLLRVAPQAAP
ncbi:ArnT family glycosyltransferase [Rhodoferax sp.]|jgi:4-amino-4-deoxy-L-arabinose transferase-like glycosyltransferase|uniref:ArnT family glycosyltransferase n=1 Tax=Rhodoferax sp. TaxID=50421 RepID=UPI003784D814